MNNQGTGKISVTSFVRAVSFHQYHPLSGHPLVAHQARLDVANQILIFLCLHKEFIYQKPLEGLSDMRDVVVVWEKMSLLSKYANPKWLRRSEHAVYRSLKNSRSAGETKRHYRILKVPFPIRLAP